MCIDGQDGPPLSETLQLQQTRPLLRRDPAMSAPTWETRMWCAGANVHFNNLMLKSRYK